MDDFLKNIVYINKKRYNTLYQSHIFNMPFIKNVKKRGTVLPLTDYKHWNMLLKPISNIH